MLISCYPRDEKNINKIICSFISDLTDKSIIPVSVEIQVPNLSHESSNVHTFREEKIHMGKRYKLVICYTIFACDLNENKTVNK